MAQHKELSTIDFHPILQDSQPPKAPLYLTSSRWGPFESEIATSWCAQLTWWTVVFFWWVEHDGTIMFFFLIFVYGLWKPTTTGGPQLVEIRLPPRLVCGWISCCQQSYWSIPEHPLTFESDVSGWWKLLGDVFSVHPKKACKPENNWYNYSRDCTSTVPGWWFGTFFMFHNIWDNPPTIDELHHFSRWAHCTTNQLHLP